MASKTKTIEKFDDDMVFCTVKCQKDFVKNMCIDHLTWKNDGANGKDDPKHSEYHLINWLDTDENFSIWREPGLGVTKIELATSLAPWLVTKGVKKHCKGIQVKAN